MAKNIYQFKWRILSAYAQQTKQKIVHELSSLRKIKAAAHPLGDHGVWNFNLQLTSERGICKPHPKLKTLEEEKMLVLATHTGY